LVSHNRVPKINGSLYVRIPSSPVVNLSLILEIALPTSYVRRSNTEIPRRAVYLWRAPVEMLLGFVVRRYFSAHIRW